MHPTDQQSRVKPEDLAEQFKERTAAALEEKPLDYSPRLRLLVSQRDQQRLLIASTSSFGPTGFPTILPVAHAPPMWERPV
jgi:hypothetical protein